MAIDSDMMAGGKTGGSCSRLGGPRRATVTRLAVVVGLPVFSFGTVGLTSGRGFCGSCHETTPASPALETATIEGRDAAARLDKGWQKKQETLDAHRR